MPQEETSASGGSQKLLVARVLPYVMELSLGQRQAVTKKLARSEKSRILDELTELTGWHRDYCRAAFATAGH